MSVAAPKYPHLARELFESLNSLCDARDDEDEKRKSEALIVPLLTSQSVNSVYGGDGTPFLDFSPDIILPSSRSLSGLNLTQISYRNLSTMQSAVQKLNPLQ